MSDFVKNSTDGLVTIVDGVTANAVEALQSMATLAGGAVEAPIHVAEATVTAALAELEARRADFIAALRKTHAVVTGPLP